MADDDVMLSPEFRLVAACCRWPGGDARDAAVVQAAAGVDWARVSVLLKRHRVEAQAYAALRAAKVALPADLAAALAGRSRQVARFNLMLAAQTVRLQALFDAAGIAAVMVKGTTLAALAYGDIAIKHAKDIDILVRPADLIAALRVVQGEGYRLTLPRAELSQRQLADVVRYGREVELRDAKTGIAVELHWRLTDNPRLLPGIDPGGTTQHVAIGGGRVRTLPRGDLFAYLCVHGAAHGWIRLKWLADVAALLSHEGPDGIDDLYRESRDRGVGAIAGQTLLLAEKVLGVTLPAGLATNLRADRRVRRLVASALDVMAGPGAEAEIAERRFGQLRLIRARLLLARDAGDWRATARSHLVALEDVLALPLPRALHFLYAAARAPIWAGRRVRALAGYSSHRR